MPEAGTNTEPDLQEAGCRDNRTDQPNGPPAEPRCQENICQVVQPQRTICFGPNQQIHGSVCHERESHAGHKKSDSLGKALKAGSLALRIEDGLHKHPQRVCREPRGEQREIGTAKRLVVEYPDGASRSCDTTT